MFIFYGPVSKPDLNYKHMDLENFTGSPLITSMPGNSGIQGQCATYTFWADDQNPTSSGNQDNFDLYWFLDEVSLPSAGGKLKPGTFSVMSLHGIRAIAQSPFLFARKLVNNTFLAKEDKDGTSMSDDFTFEKAWLENVISCKNSPYGC